MGGWGAQFSALGEEISAAQRTGDLARAEDLARQRLSVAESARSTRMIGNAYRNLGNILRLRGRLADAGIMLRKAQPLIENENGRNSPQAINVLFNLGQLYSAQARYADARAVLRDALDRQLATDAEDQYAIHAWLWLANVERLLGRPGEAMTLLDKADATPGKVLVNDPFRRDAFALQRLRLQSAYRRAQTLAQQGRHAASAAEARRAAEGFERLEGAQHPDFIDAQIQLGQSLLDLGQPGEAEPLLRQAVAAGERVFGRAHRNTGEALWGLARALAENGKSGEAEPLFRRAIDNQREAGAANRQAVFERSFAQFLVQRQRLSEALDRYRQALDLIDRVFAQTRGLDDATRDDFIARFSPYYNETLQLLLRLHRQQPDAGHDHEALAVVSRTQSRLFTEMLRHADAGRYVADPAFVALRQRQDALAAQLDELHRAQALNPYENDGTGDEAPPPRDPIVAARVAETRRALTEEIAAAERELVAVENALREKFPRFMDLAQPRPVTVEMLQRELLKPGETLLSYYLLPDRTLIFLIERHRYRLTEAPHARQEIAALVAAARRSEENAGAGFASLASLDPQVLFRLHQALFQPVEALLKPGQRILAIGDGPVHTLPLEMLIDRWGEKERRVFDAARAAGRIPLGEYATLPYLAQKFHFTYLPSLSALASVRLYRKPAIRYDRELVSFADPVFETGGDPAQSRQTREAISRAAGTSTTLSIPRLPETADEAREIAAILGGRSNLYLREDAQEHTAKTLDLKATRYLHFATHGLLGGEFVAVRAALGATSSEEKTAERQRSLTVVRTNTPESSVSGSDGNTPPPAHSPDRGQPALLLSLSGNLQGEDGLLTMSEVIENLDLNAQMVVLSACNTAGEKLAAGSGEGFAGLTRAFMYAGAQSLLVSHWSVESRSTQALVTELFRNLKQGDDSLAALEHARETIRTGTGGGTGSDGPPVSRAHPYFWAPFVHVGD